MRLPRSVERAVAKFDPRYPATQALSQVFGTNDRKTPRRPGRLGGYVDVVSERLCDDVISYLAPTLEQHKGCTIIDVHPGACLFSSKLHDYLKPKRHLLMEPETRYFDPFIKPLLEKPDSNYVHTTLTGAHQKSYWGNYRKILDEGELIEPRPQLAEDDPKLRQLDPSLLVIGNLWRSYGTSSAAGSVKFATLVLQHMTYAGLSNEIFQRTGLVRQLWWVPEKHKAEVFARATTSRTAFNIGLAMGAHINEVCGIYPLQDEFYDVPTRPVRAPGMDDWTSQRVQQDMAKQGIQLPAGRDTLGSKNIPPELDKIFRPNPLEASCKSVEDLTNLIAEHSQRVERLNEEDLFKSLSNAGRHSKWLWALDTIKYPQSRLANGEKDTTGSLQPTEDQLTEEEPTEEEPTENSQRRKPGRQGPSTAARNMRQEKTTLSVDIYLRQLNLEATYAEVEEHHPSNENLPDLKTQILQLCESIVDVHSYPRTENSGYFAQEVMGHQAKPGSFMRDKRLFEPFKYEPEEFWPTYHMTLLDITPKPRDLSVVDLASRKEGAKTCQELLKLLFNTPAATVPLALERIAPNAGEDLIPMVPEITDARRGGRLDPNKLIVKDLTEEMVEGLVKAFYEWPFRPSSQELALATGEEGGEEEPVPASFQA